jgi:hypothetical protein
VLISWYLKEIGTERPNPELLKRMADAEVALAEVNTVDTEGKFSAYITRGRVLMLDTAGENDRAEMERVVTNRKMSLRENETE